MKNGKRNIIEEEKKEVTLLLRARNSLLRTGKRKYEPDIISIEEQIKSALSKFNLKSWMIGRITKGKKQVKIL